MRKSILAVLAAAALVATPLLAQQQNQGPGGQQQPSQVELKDGELQMFVSVLQSVQEVQSQAQQDVESSLQDQGLSKKRFNEIHQQKQQSGQSNSSSGSANVTQQEEQSYQAVLKDLQKIRQETSQQIQSIIKDEGFSLNRFNAVYRAVQSRPELQKRVQNLMSSSG